MADTERFDAPADLERKVQSLTEMIRNSRFFIIFTGPYLSISPPPPPSTTTTTTTTTTTSQNSIQQNKQPTVPSFTHLSVISLFESGLLKGLVTQSTDGLHRRSGVPIDQFAEVRGNSLLEKCGQCCKEYLRDFPTRKKGTSNNEHETGRKCARPGCGGKLRDNTFQQGEELPQDQLNRAVNYASEADLFLVLGSNLHVSDLETSIPKLVAARIHMANNGGRIHPNLESVMQFSPEADATAKLVICNTQPTPLDGFASLRIFAKSDDLIRQVMSGLQLEVPRFKLRRRVLLRVEGNPFGEAVLLNNSASTSPSASPSSSSASHHSSSSSSPRSGSSSSSSSTTMGESDWKLNIHGVDQDDLTVPTIRQIIVVFDPSRSTWARVNSKKTKLKSEPFEIPGKRLRKHRVLRITIKFSGYLDEPQLTLQPISIDLLKKTQRMAYTLIYELHTRVWTIIPEDDLGQNE